MSESTDLEELLEKEEWRLLAQRCGIDTRLAEIAEIREKLREVQRFAEGVALSDPDTHPPPAFDEPSWPAMRRTDAVEEVLRRSSRPLTPNEVMERLQDKGRDDKYDAVAATLSYLSGEKRAHTQDGKRGRWLAGPAPESWQ